MAAEGDTSSGEAGSKQVAAPPQNSASEEENPQGDRRAIVLDLRNVHLTCGIAAAAGALGALLFAVASTRDTASAASVLGGALLVGGAFALLGGLVGFLFAIPRSRQIQTQVNVVQGADASTPHLQRLSDYAANTNLEQISDWLTKIIVGLSLTQYDRIAAWFIRTADTLSPLLGTGPRARSAAFALMSYSVLWGFFYIYLLTRLWMPKALSRAEREEEVEKQKAEVEKQLAGKEAALYDLENHVYNSLYEDPPQGYTKAIETIRRYLGERGAQPSARLWMYLACAYGQKHKEAKRAGNADVLRSARDQAVEAIRKAVQDPSAKTVLARMYRSPGPGEDDLESLKGDPEIEPLLG